MCINIYILPVCQRQIVARARRWNILKQLVINQIYTQQSNGAVNKTCGFSNICFSTKSDFIRNKSTKNENLYRLGTTTVRLRSFNIYNDWRRNRFVRISISEQQPNISVGSRRYISMFASRLTSQTMNAVSFFVIQEPFLIFREIKTFKMRLRRNQKKPQSRTFFTFRLFFRQINPKLNFDVLHYYSMTSNQFGFMTKFHRWLLQ